MRNQSVRETLRFLSNDAKDFLRALPDDQGLDSLEIVDRHEDEILSYIEKLEREVELLKRENAA